MELQINNVEKPNGSLAFSVFIPFYGLAGFFCLSVYCGIFENCFYPLGNKLDF